MSSGPKKLLILIQRSRAFAYGIPVIGSIELKESDRENLEARETFQGSPKTGTLGELVCRKCDREFHEVLKNGCELCRKPQNNDKN